MTSRGIVPIVWGILLSVFSVCLHYGCRVCLDADVYHSRRNPLITTTSVVPQQPKEQLLFLYIQVILIFILGVVVVVIFCVILLKLRKSSSVPERCLSTAGAKRQGKHVLIDIGVQLDTMLQFLCRTAHLFSFGVDYVQHWGHPSIVTQCAKEQRTFVWKLLFVSQCARYM